MKVGVWSYLEEYEVERSDILDLVDSVFSSGKLILGDNVEAFEKEFPEYCQSQYGIGVNSATDALFLSLKCLDIGQSDEVITVANTAVPTVSAIVSAGATPVFCDIDPNTYLMDINRLEELITDKTKCLLPVHLYGQCVDMDALNTLAIKYDLSVIEDCAQSHGALYKNKKSGSMSDLSAFSFYPTKLLGGYGDGGMVVTNQVELSEKIKRLRFYGMEKTYYAIENGFNSRLDEVQAAILRFKLKRLDDCIEKRQKLAQHYNEQLSATGLVLPKTSVNNTHAYYIYVCRHPDRDKIIAKLKNNDIHVNISYPWPIHTMKAYDYLGYKNGDLPHTEFASKQIFSLPLYPQLSAEKQNYVIDTLKRIT